MSTIKKRIIISTLAQIGSQIIGAICGLIIVKTITSSLGVTGYGLYATIFAFVTTFALLTDLGVNGITGRDIAKRPDDASHIIGHNMGLRLALSILILPIITLLGFLFYPNASADLHYGIFILSIFLTFDAIRSVSLAYFTAKIRNDITAVIAIIQQTSFLLGVIFVLKSKGGLYGFLVAYVVTNLISAVIAFTMVQREIDARPRTNLTEWRQVARRSVALGIIIVINAMYLKADSVMLSVLDSTTAVGIYGIAYSLILMIMAIPAFLMTALIPSMTTSKKNDFQKLVQSAFHIMILFGCLLVVAGYMVRKDIVVAISDSSFVAAAAPFAILALASAFSALNFVFGFASVSANKHQKMVYVSISTLLLNICINLVAIPHYGVVGAAWATAFCELLAAFGVYFVFHKEMRISVNLRIMIKPLACALISLLVTLKFQQLVNIHNHVIRTVLYGTFVSLIYGILLYATRALPNEVYATINSYLRKLVRH